MLPSTKRRTCAAARSWEPTPRPARSTAICKAGTCPTCSSWARARFRKTPATIQPARLRRSPTGRLTRSGPNISRTWDLSSMRKLIARRIAGAAIASLIVASSLVGPSRAQTNKFGTSLDPQNFGQIERGRYLAVAGDCASCHTVPRSNQPFAGGRPIETPFGVVVGANITPDPETGIGAWSDELFVRALREGKGHNGPLLYPAMPYPYYTKLTESDALAIRAYLNTVKPVRNAVVSNKLPFPFDVREGMTAWNAIYFRSGEFKPDPTKSAEWNRGAYLVEGLGHCGACHTPKTTLGGDEGERAFQ